MTEPLLAKLGRSCANHSWRTVLAWVVIAGFVVGSAGLFGGAFHDDYGIPGLPSTVGYDLLKQEFPDVSGTDARVVLHSAHGRLPDDAVSSLGGRLAHVSGVSSVSPPRISADGGTALFTLAYRIPVTDFAGSEGVDALRSAAAPSEAAGYEVTLGGEVPENFAAPGGTAELVGIAAAVLILVFVFGSIAAAGLPLAVTLFGVGTGTAGLVLLAGFTDISPTAPTIATMVGVGVGIDYALLLASRFGEYLDDGRSVVDAAGAANATAGASVLIAGAAVLLSLLGLRLADLPVISSFGYATFVMVVFVVATSPTLVPALCGLAGHRIKRTWRVRRIHRRPITERWVSRINGRPLPWAIAGLLVLLHCAAPVLGLRTWPQDASSQPTSNTTRVAYDLIEQEFGAGANGPLTVVIDLAYPGIDTASVADRIARIPAVAQVFPPTTNDADTVAVFAVEPAAAPHDASTEQLVDDIRAELPIGAEVTGFTAASVDIVDRLAQRTWLVIAAVVGLSLELLTIVLRSPVVAVKAAVMNLLSVAASYGLLVAIFQWGWGIEVLGLPHPLPISTWVPILVFTILFGLSMDYEVFMLSRVREEWLAHRDIDTRIVRGLSTTSRVVTSGGAIMIAVFIGFAFDSDITVKMMGVGMAIAVLIDITIVRLILVPATMSLLGEANWWWPGRSNDPTTQVDSPENRTRDRIFDVHVPNSR